MKTLIVDAILFDMDGTLIDSTDGVIGAWEMLSESYPNLDVPSLLKVVHGVRTIDNLRNHLGIEDPEKLNVGKTLFGLMSFIDNIYQKNEVVRFEQAILDTSRKNGRRGIVSLPGVKPMLDELVHKHDHGRPYWAICTSATRAYATAALESVGIPIPEVFVTGEDVQKGKPEPDPYLQCARRCNVEPYKCLVIEDAPAGLTSAKRAGCKTLAVATSHTLERITQCNADYTVQDLSCVSVRKFEHGLEVTIDLDNSHSH